MSISKDSLNSLSSNPPTSQTSIQSSSILPSSSSSSTLPPSSIPTSSSSSPSYYLVPPLNFSYIDNNLSHCFGPLIPANLFFFKSIGIERILNFSGKSFDKSLKESLDLFNLQVQEINIRDADFPRTNLKKFEEWISICVEDLILQTSHASTLIVGNSEEFLDCVIISCMNKVNAWSVLSCINEFRRLTFPYKIKDYEQFIESFDTSLVDIKTIKPESYLTHQYFIRQEKKLILANEYDNKTVSEIEKKLHELFFSGNKLITDSSTYDPSLSLVNDKDDDD